jgi:gluconolactonase
MSFFEPPKLIEADVFASVPARLRKKGEPSTSIDANHPGSGIDCFLEGPAFDRAGNLYMVDIPYGRILRMSPRGEFDVAAQYDGWPNGMAYGGADGTMLFVTSYSGSILAAKMPVAGKTLYSHL